MSTNWPTQGILPGYLVTTAWLAQYLDAPDVRVFDSTTNLVADPELGERVQPERASFEAGHIPGAQFIDLQADLSDPDHGLRFMLPSPERFTASLRRLGVDQQSRVVIYSTGNVWWATRVWWLLRVFGFEHAHILDGGWHKWQQEQRPLETGAGTARAPGNFTAAPPRPLVASRQDVLAAIGDGAICTINALSPEQFSGAAKPRKGRAGRIPGSVNLPAGSLLDPQDKIFLPPAVLRDKFAGIGAFDAGRGVIAYCGGGIAASADVFALSLLGHPNVRLYDASMSEWANDPALPIETGVTA